jgi:excisionase family DNA binding protein
MPTTEQPIPPRLVRMETIAEHYDLATDTIRHWIAQGRLTGYRVGGRSLRVDPAEVAALVVRTVPTRRTVGR